MALARAVAGQILREGDVSLLARSKSLQKIGGRSNMSTVCVLGAGSYGTAVARVVARNVQEIGGDNNIVKLWARRKELAEEMQKTRQNGQYLPGAFFPDNLDVSSDLKYAVSDSSVVILAIPHQHVSPSLVDDIAEAAPPHGKVHLVSLAKGIEFNQTEGKLQLVSATVLEGLQKKCPEKSFEASVLMGANVYDQMGRDEFAEATLGCASADPALFQVFHDPEHFFVHMTPDAIGVELSGALKNVVSLAVGYSEGLGLGSNTKAAIIRRGLLEIMRFSKNYSSTVQRETIFESSGIADLVTTCFGGRGRGLAAEFIRCKQEKSWKDLEKEFLNGQQIPDWHNAQHVYHFLNAKGLLDDFPVFASVYRIGFEKANPKTIVDALKRDPIPLV